MANGYANRYYINAEEYDGLDNYSIVLILDSDEPLPVVCDRLRAAAREDFIANGGQNPDGWDGGTDWGDAVNIAPEICAKYGFAIESMAPDMFVTRSEYLYCPDEEDE